ncbi:MAG TPA: hypothetical protein VK689_00535, partial [Armatimonadota bacterium]|nr:hypothetical protein [Armatimonadota bacterium]
TNPEDPSLHEHAVGLRAEWLPQRERLLAGESELDRDRAAESLERSRGLIRVLDEEIAGAA